MKCPKCNSEIPDGSRYCPFCGFTIPGSDPIREPASFNGAFSQKASAPLTGAANASNAVTGSPQQISKAVLVIAIVSLVGGILSLVFALVAKSNPAALKKDILPAVIGFAAGFFGLILFLVDIPNVIKLFKIVKPLGAKEWVSLGLKLVGLIISLVGFIISLQLFIAYV